MILIPLIHNSDLFPNRNQDFPFLSAYNINLGKLKINRKVKGRRGECQTQRSPCEWFSFVCESICVINSGYIYSCISITLPTAHMCSVVICYTVVVCSLLTDPCAISSVLSSSYQLQSPLLPQDNFIFRDFIDFLHPWSWLGLASSTSSASS